MASRLKITSSFFATRDGHKVYYAAYGNPEGKKYLVVHGGPGGGTSKAMLNFFDLNNSMVVLIDQRGCGNSEPIGEIKNNDTYKLIDDFENIRKSLGIEAWHLFGGSWGSTLSLVYAQIYPQVIQGLILRGIFLGNQIGTDWLTKSSGAARIWPEAWQELNDKFPELASQDDPCAYLYKQVCSGNNEAATAFAKWEARISCHKENLELTQKMSSYPLGYTIGKLELHYMANKFFLKPGQILESANKIKIPVDIVHGRYDIVCPITDAIALNASIPQAKLHIMPNSGHSANEPEIFAKLKSLT